MGLWASGRKVLKARPLAKIVAAGASGSFVVKVGGAGAALGMEVVLARILGPQGYGIHSYVWTWIAIVSTFTMLGYRHSLVRLVAKYTTNDAWGKLKGLVIQSVAVVIVLNILIGALAAFVLDRGNLLQSEVLENVFAIGLVALPFVASTFVAEGSLRGLKHVVQAETPYRVLRPLLVAVLSLAVFRAKGSITAVDSMSCVAVASALIFAVGGWRLFVHMPKEAKGSKARYDTDGWVEETTPFIIIGAMALVNAKTDIIMIGILDGTANVGIYNAGALLSSIVAFPLMASNAIVAPLITSLTESNEEQSLQTLIGWTTGVVAVAATFLLSALLVFGDRALAMFGPGFQFAYGAMVVLGAGKLLNCFVGPVGQLLSMGGFARLTATGFGAGAVLNVVLNLLLIPRYGMMGAALASATSLLAWNIVLNCAARARLGIESSVISSLRMVTSRYIE